MGHTVRCWRCDRTIAETEGQGCCSVVVLCRRCKAKNRIDLRDERQQGIDKRVSSGYYSVN